MSAGAFHVFRTILAGRRERLRPRGHDQLIVGHRAPHKGGKSGRLIAKPAVGNDNAHGLSWWEYDSGLILAHGGRSSTLGVNASQSPPTDDRTPYGGACEVPACGGLATCCFSTSYNTNADEGSVGGVSLTRLFRARLCVNDTGVTICYATAYSLRAMKVSRSPTVFSTEIVHPR